MSEFVALLLLLDPGLRLLGTALLVDVDLGKHVVPTSLNPKCKSVEMF